MAIEDRLASFLKDAKDRERRTTNIAGVFLLKLPPSRTRQGNLKRRISIPSQLIRYVVPSSSMKLTKRNRI